MLFHIDLNIIRWVSLTLLTGLGCVLISDRLSEKFGYATQFAANFGANLTTKAKDGFGSGLFIGMLIGLIWTPCAGPILATVLVQIIHQKTEISGLIILLAFALGTSIPMFIIAYMGQRLVKQLHFFQKHANSIRRILGFLILFSVAYMGLLTNVFNLSSLFSIRPIISNSQSSGVDLENALPTPIPAPDFVGIDAWINSQPLTMQSLRGKVVLVDFWTYSCINCIRTLPYLTSWDEKYRDKGLVIVGVHSPEFEFEKNIKNVEAAVEYYKIHYPVALDNSLATFDKFNNLYWPAHYLIDQNGKIVYVHFGEGAYDITENNIRYLLNLHEKSSPSISEERTFSMNQTPETYLGYARAERYVGIPSLEINTLTDYQFPGFLSQHQWSLNGKWEVEPEKIIAKEAGAKLKLNFNAKKVYLVMGSTNNEPIEVKITLNNHDLQSITVSQHKLYELISQPSSLNGILELTVQSPGLEAYAFTFGG